MTATPADDPAELARVKDWWATSISRIAPGEIDLRGEPIADLITGRRLSEVIWLLLRGESPTEERARLLEAAMVASVDHGPQAPSIAVARMAATCGLGLNNAVASAVNLLGDVHGGAGEQCMQMIDEVLSRHAGGTSDSHMDDAARTVVREWRSTTRYVPGFGHRFHPVDPRREPLLNLVVKARDSGHVAGDHLRAGLAIETALADDTGRDIPINVDGLTAIVYGELGFPPPLGRGLFVLSRSIGALAHAWEESNSGRRIKGPLPPSILPPYRPATDHE